MWHFRQRQDRFRGELWIQLNLWDTKTQRVRASIGKVADPKSVRVSPRGTAIAAYVGREHIGLWEASTGRSAGTIPAGGPLEEPLVFLDEDLLASRVRIRDSPRVILWNVPQRRAIVRVSAATDSPNVSAVCAGRRLLASADRTRFQIIDLARGRAMPPIAWYEYGLAAYPRKATRLTFSPDCDSLALADDSGEISIWDTATGKRQSLIAAHAGHLIVDSRGPRGMGVTTKVVSDGVTALAYAPDGKTIASGGGNSNRGNGELKLWSASTGDLLASPPVNSGPLTWLSFASDGASLAAALEPSPRDPGLPPKSVDMWTIRNSPELSMVLAHRSPITALSFSPDGTQLLSKADGEPDRLWKIAPDGKALSPEVIAGFGGPTWMQTVHPSDGRVAHSHDGKLRVEAHHTDLFLFRGSEVAPQVLKSPDQESLYHSQEIWWIRLLKDGTLLSLAGDGSGVQQAIEIVRWDLAAGKPVQETTEPATIVVNLIVSPDERTFVTIGAIGPALRQPGFVHIWDMSRFRHVASLNGHRSRVMAAAFSADGRLLSTGDADGYVRMWDLTAVRSLGK